MSDIKSISHQSIHSTQSAPEGSQKKLEIEKEYKPAEFRPLSNEQKESIKLTRNAENKMAESAFMGGITRGLEEYNKRSDKSLSSAVGSDIVKNEPSKEFVKAGGPPDDVVKSPKEFLPIQTGPIGKLPEFPEFDRQLPIGTGPTGELPDLDDLKYGLKKIDKYLKPITDVIPEKIKGDS